MLRLHNNAVMEKCGDDRPLSATARQAGVVEDTYKTVFGSRRIHWRKKERFWLAER